MLCKNHSEAKQKCKGGKNQLKIIQEATEKNIGVFSLSIILRDKTQHLISKLAYGNRKFDLS